MKTIKTAIKNHRLESGKLLKCFKRGDRIVFLNGHFGEHSIMADSSEERIDAHWQGYVENNVKHERVVLIKGSALTSEQRASLKYNGMKNDRWVLQHAFFFQNGAPMKDRYPICNPSEGTLKYYS